MILLEQNNGQNNWELHQVMRKGITTDSSGNIYVTGLTQGGLDGNTNSGSNSEMWADYDIFWSNTIPLEQNNGLINWELLQCLWY